MARRIGAPLTRAGGLKGLGGGVSRYNYLTSLGTLVAAWDFALGVTTVSGSVDSITDQSGRGNTLSAAAAGNRPTYTASSATFNGQPTATGDGVTHYLRDTAISMGAAFSPGTLLIVARLVTNTSNDCCFSLSTSTQVRESTLNRIDALVGTGSYTTTATFNTVPHVFGLSANGSSFQSYVDGAAEGSPVAYTGTVADGSAVALFARSDGVVPSNVEIAWAGISLSSISSQQHADFAAYARSRWGTP